MSSSMVAQAGQALAWPVSDDAGIPTPVWAITNERRNSVIAFLVCHRRPLLCHLK
nr:ash family protein [Escherichia coli]